MDDLEQRLNSLLSDPESLSRLTELAGGILGGQAEGAEKSDGSDEDDKHTAPKGFDLDLAAFGRISSLLGNMREDSEDSRLLLALKPYLKDKRREKVDETVKLMKLMKLAPLLKDIKL